MNEINTFLSQLQYIVLQNHQHKEPSYSNNDEISQPEDEKSNNSLQQHNYTKKRFDKAFQMIVQTQIMMNPAWYNSINNPAGIQMCTNMLESNPMILTMTGIQPNESNEFIHFFKERLTENMIQNKKKRQEFIHPNGLSKKALLNANAVQIGNYLMNDALQSARIVMNQTDDPQNFFMFPFSSYQANCYPLNKSNQLDDNQEPNDDEQLNNDEHFNDNEQSNKSDDEDHEQNDFLNHTKKHCYQNLSNHQNLHENKCNQMNQKDCFHSSKCNCARPNCNGNCKCCVDNCINHRLTGFDYCFIHKCCVNGCNCQKEPLSLYCLNHKCLLCNNPRCYNSQYCELHRSPRF